MLRTLGKTTWEKIKINDVFAFEGCWSVLCKVSSTEALFLDSTEDWWFGKFNRNFKRGEIFSFSVQGGFRKNEHVWDLSIPFGLITNKSIQRTNNFLYKLPKSVQKLFKEE